TVAWISGGVRSCQIAVSGAFETWTQMLRATYAGAIPTSDVVRASPTRPSRPPAAMPPTIIVPRRTRPTSPRTTAEPSRRPSDPAMLTVVSRHDSAAIAPPAPARTNAVATGVANPPAT